MFFLKRIILFVFLISLLLCSGCSSRETVDPSAPLSPAIGQLKDQSSLVRCTANDKDLAFSQADFCSLTGAQTEYIVIGTLPEKGLLMLGGKAVIAGQTIPVTSLNYLKYVPEAASGASEVFFTFTAKAPGWENRELTATVAVQDGENFPPVASDLAAETFASVACFAVLPVSDPNGDEVDCKITLYPRHGFVSLENGNAIYRPAEGFVGEDSFCYVASDRFGNLSAERKVTVTVTENKSGIYFADLTGDPIHNAAISLCADEIMTYRKENGAYYFDPSAPVSKIDCLIMMMCLTGQTEIVTAVTDTEAMDDKTLSAGKKGFLQAGISCGAVYLQGGSFHPEEELTAADAAYMAVRLLGIPVLSAKQEFADLQTVPAWACTALVSADAAGILQAKDGKLDAERVLTRADLAEILQNMKDYR